MSEGEVVIAERFGGLIRVRRSPAQVELVLPNAVSVEAIIHPIATTPLALLASWRGDATIHGGAFVHAGRAWVVCGRRGAGKSTLLAAIARRGSQILADDLVVVTGGRVLAGPSSVDLRPDAVARFPEARSMGVVVDRTRHRLATEGAPASAELGGICLLEWCENARPAATQMTTAEKVDLLHSQHYAGRLGPPSAKNVFDLLEHPMWKVTRRRSWSSTDATIEAIFALSGP